MVEPITVHAAVIQAPKASGGKCQTGQSGGGACCCGPAPQPPKHSAPVHCDPLEIKPLNKIPLRCGAEPKKYCGCNKDPKEFKKRLPNGGACVTFCSDGACGTACAGSGACAGSRPRPGACRPKNVCAPIKTCLKTPQNCQLPRSYRCTDHGHGDRARKSDAKHSPRQRAPSCSSSGSDSCCVCEHGVKFQGCCPSPPPGPVHIIERQKPVITVHNTELCTCESKWKLIERWQAAAKKRESKKRREEESQHRERAKERYRKRVEATVRHRECLMLQKELDRRRRQEEEDWRQQREAMEDRRLDQEYEMWLEDLLQEEANQRALQEAECRKESRRWREQQLPRSGGEGGKVIPELEELRRVLAPIDQGPHEIFEYFALEPQPEIIQQNPDEIARAMMGMRCSEGIHIKVGDSQQKKASLRVNMGPPSCGVPSCCGPSANTLVPPEVVQMMMKIKENTNNPCLGFTQTSPHWTKLQGQLSLPVQVAPSLAPYYGSPAPGPPQMQQSPYPYPPPAYPAVPPPPPHYC